MEFLSQYIKIHYPNSKNISLNIYLSNTKPWLNWHFILKNVKLG